MSLLAIFHLTFVDLWLIVVSDSVKLSEEVKKLTFLGGND